MKMWKGRFRKPLDLDFERWQRSFPFDQRLLSQEIAASCAHARALAKAEVLSESELRSVLEGLKRVESLAGQNAPVELPNDEPVEDIHHYVEAKLVSLIGDVGYKLHSGRSRNDQIATDLRLFVRNSIDGLTLLIAELLEELAARAEQAGGAAMPAYTHLQPAEPVLVAHWLLAYAEMFLRDCARLSDCRQRSNVCPLGSGAVAGTTLALDREAMAEELGFQGVTANSIDATSDRDFAIELVQALCLLGIHLSRWAEEMIIFSTQEYSFVRLPESYSTGSSAMPQKKNPDALELIRAQVARLIGNATTLMVTMKGLPLAYNKDLQESQQPVFDSVDIASHSLKTASGFLREVEFDYPRMQAATETGFMNAMAAAMYLVKKGVPFRQAHEHIGNAIRRCLDKECELRDLSLNELREFCDEFDEDFYSSLGLDAVLACHDVAGGTHPQRVGKALQGLRQQIATLRGEVHAHA